MPHKDPAEQRRYHREWKQGLRRGRRQNTQLQRLLALMVASAPDQCWIWPGGTRGRKPYLYGDLRINGKHHSTHRFAYELVAGPIPEGLTLDHLCRTRLCFNPAHLEPVTNLENCRRAHAATETHCSRGHERSPENVYVDQHGARYCRPCQRAGKRRRRAAARASRALTREAVTPPKGPRQSVG